MSNFTLRYTNGFVPNRKGADLEPELLFQSRLRPRTVSNLSVTYSEITQIFHDQVLHEKNSLSSNTDTDYVVYQPIFGNEKLAYISNLSEHRYTSVFELEQTLSQLSRAVADWDLLLIQNALKSQELDDYLQVVRISDDTEERKRRIIKKLILEYITGAVHPLRHIRVIREKELNLVILLNTL